MFSVDGFVSDSELDQSDYDRLSTWDGLSAFSSCGRRLAHGRTSVTLSSALVLGLQRCVCSLGFYKGSCV